MPLPFPNLDDRSFDQLVNEARARIAKDLNTDWTELSAGDPGVVLLEAFAYLTDQMIYRLNRLPRKVYVAFLRMLGVTMDPPVAAHVTLKAWLAGQSTGWVLLPRGSMVSTAQRGAGQAGERPVFTIIQDVDLPPSCDSEEKSVSVLAYHCERVEESLGQSQGTAGQIFQVKRGPIVARLPEEASWLELVVGVEVTDPAKRQKSDWIGSDGKAYHLWNEVENFSAGSPAGEDYLVDRQAGLIYFAPAGRGSTAEAIQAMAAVPPAGREIRAWYAHGGGASGNVGACQLNALVAVPGRADLPAVQFTNPMPARGGFDAETLENALARGPQEIYSRSRAVTTREFQSVALSTGHAARALALPQASLWQHAVPGTVDIVVVPRLAKGQAADLDSLLAAQEAETLDQIEAVLRDRSPIGIRSQPRWARYKQVSVDAVVAYRGSEEAAVIANRVIDRLNQLISPMPSDPSGAGEYSAGWQFGQPLRVADIYSQIIAGEGPNTPITSITSLDLCLEHAPSENVTCLAADSRQPHTWYAGSGCGLFRSTNDGSGWELVLDLSSGSRDRVYHRHGPQWRPGPVTRLEFVRHVYPNPDFAGMVAFSAEAMVKDDLQTSLYLSLDCGESWYRLTTLQKVSGKPRTGAVADMAWLTRGNRPVLLLATDGGLVEVNLEFGPDGCLTDADVSPVAVLKDRPDYPVYALTVVRSDRGGQLVVAALKGRRGVYTAPGDSLGTARPFDARPIRENDLYPGEDIRHVAVQYLDDKIYLWAAAMALSDNGQGCYRWEIDQTGAVTGEGRWISQGWSGGSCLAVAFDHNQVYAATAWGGLLRAEVDERNSEKVSTWKKFLNQDLPRRPAQMESAAPNSGTIEPLIALDARDGVVITASQNGIFRRKEPEENFDRERFENVSRSRLCNLKDTITIPPDWLLVSKQHRIRAYREDAGHSAGIAEEEA